MPENVPLSEASATAQGITITIDQAYADPGRTTIQYHISRANTVVFSDPHVTLSDACGHVYPFVCGTTGIAAFTPLAPGLLSAPQPLTLNLDYLYVLQPKYQPIRGPWHVTFQVQPHLTRAVALRLRLHLSGLPQATSPGFTMLGLRSFIAGFVPGGTSTDGPADITLHVAGESPQTLALFDPDSVPAATNSVGVDLIYLGMQMPEHGTAELSLPAFNVAIYQDGALPTPANPTGITLLRTVTVTGPRTFAITF